MTCGQLNTGPSLQTNAPPNWQCPQWPDSAMHVALHAEEDAGLRQAMFPPASGRHLHHAFRPAHNRPWSARVALESGQTSSVTRPTCHGQSGPPSSAATSTRVSGMGIPLGILFAPDHVLGFLHPLDDGQMAVTCTTPEHVMNDRHNRGAAQAAGDDHHILAFIVCIGQPFP